ncbi:hypothetical protein, partial [Mycobacterium decipiens]
LRIEFRDPAPFAVLRRIDRWLWHRRRPPALSTPQSTIAAPQTTTPAPSSVTTVDHAAG